MRMKNLFLFLLFCTGIFRVGFAQDSILPQWKYIVDDYIVRLENYTPILERENNSMISRSEREKKIKLLRQHELAIENKLKQELTRRKDPLMMYSVKGGYLVLNAEDIACHENLVDSLLNALLQRNAEGRIKSPADLSVLTKGAKPGIKKIDGSLFSCSVPENKILKNKLKGSWRNQFYKDEKGKEIWKLFAATGLIAACSGIDFFENDSCKESVFGTVTVVITKRKQTFPLKMMCLLSQLKPVKKKRNLSATRL
jgi:hypothetical protein